MVTHPLASLHATVLGAALLLGGAVGAQPHGGDAVPSGAVTSLTALQQAYRDAAISRQPAKLEALFDMTSMSPAISAEFIQHLQEEFSEPLLRIRMDDPDPGLVAKYASFHAKFSRPVVKILRVTHRLPKGDTIDSEYFVGSSAGRYFFITAQQQP